LFPLAEYSPEWVALTWALRKKRQARFIDLPAETFLALGGTREPKAEKPSGSSPPPVPQEQPTASASAPAVPPPAPAEPATDTQAYLADPYNAIARLSGEPDHETWWEKHFEHSTEADSYREAIFQFGVGLREIDYETPRRREETRLREAFMRRAIRET